MKIFNHKKRNILFLIMLFIFVNIFSVGYQMYLNNLSKHSYGKTVGYVSTITKRYSTKHSSYIYLTYSVDNKEYKTKYDYYSNSLKKGDKFDIFYDLSSPKYIFVKEFSEKSIRNSIGLIFLSIVILSATYIYNKNTI